MAGGFAPSTKTDEAPATYAGRIGNDILYPMNMAFRRSIIEAIGDFDERLGPGTPFPAAEDNDFGFRLLEAGYTIHYVPEAVLYHRAWRSAEDFVHLRWSYGRGQGAYYAKHFDLRDRYMLRRMTAELMHTLNGVGGQALALRPRAALGHAAYLAGLLTGAADFGLHARRERPEERRTGR